MSIRTLSTSIIVESKNVIILYREFVDQDTFSLRVNPRSTNSEDRIATALHSTQTVPQVIKKQTIVLLRSIL